MVGYKGKMKMLQAIYGDPKKKGFSTPRSATAPQQGVAVVDGGKARPLTPAAFDAMFGSQKPRKFIVPAKGPTREVR